MQASLNNKAGIIIPTINRPLLLERSVTSIMNQSFNNWCLIIVNDGGDEEEIEHLISYLKKKHNCTNEIIILSSPQRVGKAAACNSALSLMKTQFVIILNDDDVWAYEFLSVSISQLELLNAANNNTRGIISLANVMHEELLEDHIYISWVDVPGENETNPYNNYVHLQSLAVQNSFSSSQFLFYKSAIDTIGPLKEDLVIFSDWEFHLRFCCSFSIFIITQPFVNIHKRFYATDNSYLNSLKVHAGKIEYYNERITDSLLRERSLTNNNNTTALLQLQTILFLRLQKSVPSCGLAGIQPNPYPADLREKIESLIHKVNHLEHESRRTEDWFRYLEYMIQPFYIRKGKKMVKFVGYCIRLENKPSNLKKFVKSLYKNGFRMTLTQIKNKLNENPANRYNL